MVNRRAAVPLATQIPGESIYPFGAKKFHQGGVEFAQINIHNGRFKILDPPAIKLVIEPCPAPVDILYFVDIQKNLGFIAIKRYKEAPLA